MQTLVGLLKPLIYSFTASGPLTPKDNNRGLSLQITSLCSIWLININ